MQVPQDLNDTHALQTLSLDFQKLEPHEQNDLPAGMLMNLALALENVVAPHDETAKPQPDHDAQNDQHRLAPHNPPQTTSLSVQLQAARLLLDLVTCPHIPHILYSEELAEAMVAFTKRAVAAVVAPVAPATGPASKRGSSADNGAPPTPTKAAAATARANLASALALVFERLCALVPKRCMDDPTVLQLADASIRAAFAPVSTAAMHLQSAAAQLLVAIFGEYGQYRQSILLSVVDGRLEAAEQPVRAMHALPNGLKVQQFSALVLQMVQVCAPLVLTPADAANAATVAHAARTPPSADGSSPAAHTKLHPFKGAVFGAASVLVQVLVTRALERGDDPDARALLEVFARDCLELIGLVDWPASAACASLLAGVLCRRLGTLRGPQQSERRAAADKAVDKEQNAARLFSLDLLGQVLATVAHEKRLDTEHPLCFPLPREEYNIEAQPTDAGEVSGCPCGKGYGGTFMLDCDLCHRWFHGQCVGIAADESNVPDEWICDDCLLSTAVAAQRRTTARLLALGRDVQAAEPDVSPPAVPLPPKTAKTAKGARKKRKGGGGCDDDEPPTTPPAPPKVVAFDATKVEEELSSEAEVTKQLLLNHLAATMADDPAAAAAYRVRLCEWHCEAAERHAWHLCRLYEELYAAAAPAAATPAGDRRRKPMLSRHKMSAAVRKLLAVSPLCSKLETMLSYLVAGLREPLPSLRTRAMKAVSGVVRADPATLELGSVQRVVHAALGEPSIAVREATLDLLGQFVLSRPACVQKYYEAIASRITDAGISVRRRVVRILREICVHEPTSPTALDACRRLMSRVADEDEVAKNVTKVFHSLWFAPAPDGGAPPQADAAARTEQMVAVVCGASAHLDGWLQQLLVKVLRPPPESAKGGGRLPDGDGGTPTSGGAGAQEQRDALAAQVVCESLVAQLVERLLGTGEAAAGGKGAVGAAATLRVLSLFCKSKPSLLLHYVDLLPAYLEYGEHSASVPYVCEMLPPLLSLQEHPSSTLLEKLERYLGALVFRVPEPLLQTTARALCATVLRSRNAQLLQETLARLCHMMERASQPEEAARLREQLYRSMLLSGLFCRYFNFEAKEFAAEAAALDGSLYHCTGDVSHSVACQIGRFVPGGEAADAGGVLGPQAALYAIKAIGHICVRRTDLLPSWNLALAAAWAPAGPVQLKQAALTSLHELLRSDATGAESAAEAADSAAETSAVVTAALQQQLEHTLEALGDARHHGVRRAALSLLEEMLRRGLVHPMACLPHVIALEVDADPQGCAPHARAVLRTSFERHPRMVGSAGVAVTSMLLSFRLQRGLRIAASKRGSAADAASIGTPRYVFELLAGSRRERFGLLRALVNLLKPTDLVVDELVAPPTPPPSRRASELESTPLAHASPHGGDHSPTQGRFAMVVGKQDTARASDRDDSLGVEYAEWVARTLANLPYDREEEPLLLVQQIGRMLSLHADTTLGQLARELGVEVRDVHTIEALEHRAVRGASRALDSVAGAAASHCVLLLLKVHLKRAYGLTDAKCRAFDADVAASVSGSAAGRLVVRIEQAPALNLEALRQMPTSLSASSSTGSTPTKPPTSGNGRADKRAKGSAATVAGVEMVDLSGARLVAARYMWLKRLLDEDDDELDFSPTARARPRATDAAGGNARNQGGQKRGAPIQKTVPAKKKKTVRRKKQLATDDESQSDPNDEDWCA